MRSIKAMLLLATAAVVVTAFTVPAMASASSWTKNGGPFVEYQEPYWTGTSGEELNVITGSFNFSGGADCSAGGSIDFKNNEIKNFYIPSSNCKPTGAMKGFGCTAVKSVTSAVQPLFAPRIVENSRYVNIGVELTYLFEGGIFCPKEVKISGVLKGTPDNASSINHLTLSGELTSSVKGITAAMTGDLAIAPAGKFGIKGTTQVNLEGSLEFGYAGCKANGTMGFGANGTGTIESLNWSSCTARGTFFGCSATVASSDLPWAIKDEGSTVKVTAKVTETVSGCMYAGTYQFTGPISLTPNKASEVSSSSASGTLSTGIFSGTVSGSLNWSPAKVYGL
jgi:hypothetical protein